MEIRYIRAGKSRLNEIFHEIECMLERHSCGPNMELVAIGLSPGNKDSKCIMQCQCAYGFIEANGRCSKIIKNIVSLINILF